MEQELKAGDRIVDGADRHETGTGHAGILRPQFIRLE